MVHSAFIMEFMIMSCSFQTPSVEEKNFRVDSWLSEIGWPIKPKSCIRLKVTQKDLNWVINVILVLVSQLLIDFKQISGIKILFVLLFLNPVYLKGLCNLNKSKSTYKIHLPVM